MNLTITMLYFSGTGNSRYIAEIFASKMGADCHSIEDGANFIEIIKKAETIAFFYPIYGSRIPRPMRDFAAKHKSLLKGKKLIIFCTQAMFSGDGARAFVDLLPKNHAKIIYADHFIMPNNIPNIPFMSLPSKRQMVKYKARAKRKMARVCGHIKRGVIVRRGFNLISQALGLIQGAFWPKIEKWGADKIRVGKNCINCGLCVKICPVDNFVQKKGKITPKDNCALCFRCIHKCPQKAISIFFRRTT